MQNKSDKEINYHKVMIWSIQRLEETLPTANQKTDETYG